MNGDDDATIFVVDDDEAVLASLQALLRSIGLRVQGFCGGRSFSTVSCHPASAASCSTSRCQA